MNRFEVAPIRHRPARWQIALALVLVYFAWGTTYLAIKEGVRTLPPALFGGGRIALAGLILLGYLALRGEPLRLPRREFIAAVVGGVLLFVCGNGLITVAEKTVDSGVASVLVATTPLWMALLETCWPWGERLNLVGWLGVILGLGGVVLLLLPRLESSGYFQQDIGPLLVLGSAASWALGSFVLRHWKRSGSLLASAAYQMLLGGLVLIILGLAVGETDALTPDAFTPVAIWAFFHLLILGSLIGFVAYNWLLGHVSTTLAGTYAYINPVLAILASLALTEETITWRIVGGMLIILAGVALVRRGAGSSWARTGAALAEVSLDPARNGKASSVRQPTGRIRS